MEYYYEKKMNAIKIYFFLLSDLIILFFHPIINYFFKISIKKKILIQTKVFLIFLYQIFLRHCDQWMYVLTSPYPDYFCIIS